ATSTASVRDYVRHGREALLVPPGDPEALAAAITQLDSDPALLSTMSASARAAARRLSTEHWAEQIVTGKPVGTSTETFGTADPELPSNHSLCSRSSSRHSSPRRRRPVTGPNGSPAFSAASRVCGS